MPRAPWHIVQRSASVAPRPIDSALAPLNICGTDLDPRRRVICADDLLPAGRRVDQPGGTADRVPHAVEPRAGWTSGSQTKPATIATMAIAA